MRKLFVIMVLVFMVGCSNTLKYIPSVEDTTDEKSNIIKNVIREDNSNADNDESLVYGFEVNRVEYSTLVNEKYTVNTEQFTPYQGARELYEIPYGFIGIPGAILLNIFDIFPFFGAIDNEFLGKQFASTFSGLNPFINIESEKRSEFKEISRTLASSKEEEVKKITPLTGESIKVCVNETSADNVDTDEFGRIAVDMFTILSGIKLNAEPRKITVYMNPANDDSGEGNNLSCNAPGDSSIVKYFKRDMAYNLFDANKRLYSLYQTDNLLPQDAAKAVYSLDGVGFEKWSMRAEDELRNRKKNDEQFIEAFSNSVRNLFENQGNETAEEVPLNFR